MPQYKETTLRINDNLTIVLVRKKIKNINLSISAIDGVVRVSAPMRTKDEIIQMFILSKLEWIEKHQKKFALRAKPIKIDYVDGDAISYLGTLYTLKIIHAQAKQKAKVSIVHNEYIELIISENADITHRKKAITDWYRKELKKILPALIHKWEPIVGVKINSWGVRAMKRKWGTCFISKKHIVLNVELMQKPTYCLEYVVVHELVHLLERYHNKRFYGFLDVFMPEWETYQKELNEYAIDD